MADGIFAATGIVLAVPGVIDLLIQYGESIYQKVNTFRNAKGEWAKLGQYGWSLGKGELKGIVLTAKSFYLEEGCDPGLKNSLELQIRKLASDIEATQIFLEGQNIDHLVERAIFAISGQRRAKELNKTLTLDKDQLAQILCINDIKTRRVPDQLLITDERFLRSDTAEYQPVPSTTHLVITMGDYREDAQEGPYRKTDVIIEKSDASETTLKKITAFLYYRLPEKISLQSADVVLKGILPCLGYRMQPAPELLFKMPEGDHDPQMLHTMIAADHGAIRHPLDFRFQLAKRLSNAVLRVNAAGLVHKNIRTNTILILQPKASAVDDAKKNILGLGDVYLTNWSLLRDVSGPTPSRGGNQWTEDLYRHPRRQGIHVQDRYNMGHDIYSLGVCLLEIGLWDLLVHESPVDGQPQVSELFRAAAGVDSHPDPEAELRSKLSRPTDIKNILLDLARANLPQKMGLGYRDLVVACLTGLDAESGFGPEVNFKEMNQVERGVAFKELVLSFFTEMSTSWLAES